MSRQSLTKEEEQLLELCGNKDAPVSAFTALLDKGARLNIYTKEGWHPLWRVSYRGRSDLVDLFIRYGAEVDLATANKHGETALITASAKGHLETAKLLLHQGALVNFQEKDGFTALYFSSKNNHVEVMKLLLNSGAQVNKGSQTPLYGTAFFGASDAAKVLLDHGADVNQPTDTNLRSSPLQTACSHNHLQVAQLLIINGADVDYQKSNGQTSLHRAAGHGHIELVKLLLLSHAKLNIKDNAGKTPLQLAEEKKHMEIVHLLKTGVPAQPAAKISVSDKVEAISGAETGDGEEGEKEVQPSMEEGLTGEQKADDHSQLSDAPALTEAPKDDYMCVARNPLCLVYLPQEINEKLSIETVTDRSLYPRIASNEIMITPVVHITPDNASLSLKKPAIIELAKTIELSEKEGDNKVIPLYTKSNYLGWNQLGTGSVVNCRVLQDRISFQVTHFSLYAVISRKPYPSSSVRVKPASATAPPTQDHSSNTHTQLTIPELPGFKVQIPPSSINANKETNITATVLYDSPAVCSEDESSCLASSCIELEPHGITFTKPVSITLPIPGYAEMMKNDPNAQLQVWHSTKSIAGGHEERIELAKHDIRQDETGQYIAVVEIDHFCSLKTLWKSTKRAISYAKKLFKCTFNIRARCQVFMSEETQHKSKLVFSIAVLFNHYREEPYPPPHINYKHMLADSDLMNLKVSNDDTIQFGVKFNELLPVQKSEPISGHFTLSGHQQKSFMVQVEDDQAELKGGLPLGKLTLGITSGSERDNSSLILMKPSSTSSSISPYQFEESITELEEAAERLNQDANQYNEEGPGPMVETAKKIASMWMKMAELIRKECVLKERRFKEDIVDLAKSINKESQEVLRIAKSVAEACTDRIMKNAVNGVVERMQTISHQLKILAAGEASRQRDEASDLKACQLLTKNAKNLTSAISDALDCTQSASIRIPKATREKLGLTKHNIEAISITGKIVREGDHYQDSHNNEGSRGQSAPGGSISRVDLEEGAATGLSGDDHADIYYKLEGHATKWRDIGRALGFTEGEMDNIEGRPFLMRLAPNSWLGEMLTQWLEWAPGDGRGSLGFATKRALRVALLKANLGQLAQQFQ